MSAAPAPDTPLGMEVARLLERYPAAELTDATLPDGTMVTVVSIPAFPVPAGWTASSTTLHFTIPAGYPFARPDCFNVDKDLKLAGGGMPTNAALQALPGVGETLWFSWHMARDWRAGRDDLLTWVAVCANRLEQLR